MLRWSPCVVRLWRRDLLSQIFVLPKSQSYIDHSTTKLLLSSSISDLKWSLLWSSFLSQLSGIAETKLSADRNYEVAANAHWKPFIALDKTRSRDPRMTSILHNKTCEHSLRHSRSEPQLWGLSLTVSGYTRCHVLFVDYTHFDAEFRVEVLLYFLSV